ncbi:MAG: cupin domain-containing protein [Alphaproteobacteria bacterium]|nr:cupin domain-containing protein [Alphaproteobacteria bacterium]
MARAVRAAPRRRAPGAWMQAVSHGPGPARCYLLGMAAGRGVPPHSHRAGEMTVVLKGAFRDGDVILGPGDFSEHDGEVSHAPQATADGDCVCLIYTDGPLVPADWIGRIVFPLLGFG